MSSSGTVKSHFITVPDPKVQLAVGTLQGVIDPYLKDNGGEVDYIHGDDVTRELGSKPGNMGFLLPAMGKEQLFKTVMADGVLPPQDLLQVSSPPQNKKKNPSLGGVFLLQRDTPRPPNQKTCRTASS